MKDITTLIDDIDALFTKGHEPSEESIQGLANSLAASIKRSITRVLETERGPTLRMSNIGKGAKVLWYEAKNEGPKEVIDGTTARKFLMGDLWEELLLWLAEEAGHEVSNRQAEVDLEGIKGHIDAIIDNTLVDVKSASRFGFEKFRKNTLQDDDPFGYYEQLAGYATALKKDAAWLAVNKDTAELILLSAPLDDLESLNVDKRIKYLKEAVVSPEPPPRCYDPVPDGQSGNLVLNNNCTYCYFKADCWKDANDGTGLRVFDYSNKPKYFVHVEKEPRVMEIFPTREKKID